MAKTKIVATIGPSCDSEEKIKQLIVAGVDVFRFNLKHNDQNWHNSRIQRVKQVINRLDKPVGILLDLQGPEIRIGPFEEGSIQVSPGETVCFATTRTRGEKTILLDNLKLLRSLKSRQTIFIDDGMLQFQVSSRKGEYVFAKVIKGGTIGSKKGMNLPELSVDLPTLVEADLTYLDLAAREAVDFIALSFVRKREDIIILKREMEKRSVHADIIAKIENQKALDNFDEIVAETDGVMVARGDLGIEIDYVQIPYWQKEIIRKTRALGKPVITATEMLQSMVDHPRPTRAEVSDVANAVFDRTDAVMLSGETAMGKYPVEAVAAMEKITLYAEGKTDRDEFNGAFHSAHEAVVLGAYDLQQGLSAMGERVQAFAVLTESGWTAKYLSRFRPDIPIIAVTSTSDVQTKLTLSYGIIPVSISFPTGTIHSLKQVFLSLLKLGLVKRDKGSVIVVRGKKWGEAGGVNTISLEQVEEWVGEK
ncbi:pyruvate kinase [Candidatus Roizmanbacteria bacterium]|nr:pyruvate kinase [Candidatus Roizmanbacteria bacterium]